MKLSGKVALLTGAGGAMGRAIALRLAADGASVVAVDLSGEAANLTADAVRSHGTNALALQVDIADTQQVDEMVSQAWNVYGYVDAVINNAAVFENRPLLEITPDEWDRMLGTNARGLFYCVQASARRMVTRRSGTITSIASIAAMRACPSAAHYAASEAAVLSITRAAAVAFGPFGIRVNAVCPGYVGAAASDQSVEGTTHATFEPRQNLEENISSIPLGRLGTPDDVASVVTFLASPDSMYVTGQVVSVCGGFWMG